MKLKTSCCIMLFKQKVINHFSSQQNKVCCQTLHVQKVPDSGCNFLWSNERKLRLLLVTELTEAGESADPPTPGKPSEPVVSHTASQQEQQILKPHTIIPVCDGETAAAQARRGCICRSRGSFRRPPSLQCLQQQRRSDLIGTASEGAYAVSSGSPSDRSSLWWLPPCSPYVADRRACTHAALQPSQPSPPRPLRDLIWSLELDFCLWTSMRRGTRHSRGSWNCMMRG